MKTHRSDRQGSQMHAGAERRLGDLLPVVAFAALIAMLALSLLAPAIAPQDPADPLGFDPLAANHPPAWSGAYLLGADARGRSVLALLLWGGRISLPLGVGSALLAMLLGICIGLLWYWRDGMLGPLLMLAMSICQAAPPLVVLLALASRMGSVPALLIAATFAGTGWVAPARIMHATLLSVRAAPYVEAARSAGAGEWRLLRVHVLPAARAPLAAWTASAAATYLAIEAGLDFLGLGMSPDVTSWGTALAGAQDALASGNWWWISFGGISLALTTLSLGEVARGIAAGTGRHAIARSGRRPEIEPDELPDLDAAWHAWPPARLARPGRSLAWAIPVCSAAAILLGAAIGMGPGHHAATPTPRAGSLVQRAQHYLKRRAPAADFIATATYAARLSTLGARQIPWAARTVCPAGIAGTRCATSSVQLFFAGGSARAVTEGLVFVCTPRRTWSLNPMAGFARTDNRACGARGPSMAGVGATAGEVEALLPDLAGVHPRLLGSDQVAGRPCWVVALGGAGRACIDVATDLLLRLERLDRRGRPEALFALTQVSYGLDLAPELFGNPIPGGHGPLISGITQPVLDLQAADDQALFFALIPTYLPPGLTAETPTFDQFNDDRQSYALAQRVRQVFRDRRGRVALILIETLAGCAWDATPPRSIARAATFAGRPLLTWAGTRGQPALVRTQTDSTAALVSSRILPLATLERVAAGLQ